MTGRGLPGQRMFAAQRLSILDPAARIRGHAPPWAAPVCLIDAPNGFGEEVWIDGGGPETILAVRLGGAAVVCEWGPRTGASIQSGHGVTLQPTGAPNRYRSSGAVRFAQIYLPDDLIDSVAEAMGSSTRLSRALRDDIIFREDATLAESALTYIERACVDDEAPTRVEMDARATLIVECLLRRAHGLRPAHTPRGGLAPWQVRRTTEYLGANLAESVSLATLAALVDLSPFHFARAFKTSVGAPPHAYQCALRVTRAKSLLTDTSLPVTEIAAEVGYESPQALARVFRRATGLTPSAYRRRRC